ncbi:hypothetical protein FJZ27_05025 [Candidatus Peribacteria bacterium]|nr:hypothetical protein [Candidatus Peribacteria bacterium]
MPSKKTDITGERLASGKWLYDFIMREIEPDLLEEQATLDVRYRMESPIAHDARMERYERAFAEFDRVLGLVTRAMTKETQREKLQRRRALGMEEQAAKSAESAIAEESLDTFNA